MTGQAAMAAGASFDIILSDIRMPDLDGPTLYEWMQATRPDLARRIAFVTGDTLSGTAADFLERAQCPVLEKPFTPAALRALIAAMLEKRP
jgi:CheY-like chemotaxis protein